MSLDSADLSGAQVMFSLMSQFVYCYPEDETVAEYVEQDLFANVPFGQEDEYITRGLTLLQNWCSEARDTALFHDLMDDVRRDHFALFEGAGEPKAPSWAGYYLATSSPILSKETLPVRKLYAKYGFEMTRKNQEPDDDLGVMLGFIAYLISLELEGSSTADDQEFLFVKRILPWLPTWLYNVEKYAKTGYCYGMALLVFGLCRAYAKRFGVVFIEDGQNSRFCFAKE